MPMVPRFDTPQVESNALPAVPMQAPRGHNFGIDQAAEADKAARGVGNVAAQIATDTAQLANQVRIDDALNKAKEATLRLTYDKDAGYTNLRGLSAIERPGGKPLAEEYGETLKKSFDEIAAGLGNDAQRAAFQSRANGMLVNFRGAIDKHESDEFRSYSLSVSEGVQATAINEIALAWNNPEVVGEAVGRIKAETYRQAQLTGKSAEWQDAQVRKMTSNAHKTAIAAALQAGNVLAADAYLTKHSGEMEADDILRVRGIVTKEVDMKVGTGAAQHVMSKIAPRVAVGEYDRLTNIVMGMESGGRRYAADGSLLESPKGAKGEMQVLDGTNKNPGFGVTPARDDSPEERARVGRDYLGAMLREYKGDVALALAAYNWGPGNLNAAIAKSERSVKLAANDPSVKVMSWLDFAPKETRAYVERGTKEFNAGGGHPPRPTLADAKAELRSRPELAGNPQRLKFAEDRLESEFKDMEAAIKQREEESVTAAMRGLVQNGGRFSDLPVGIRAAVPPKEIDNLIGFGQKIAKGDDTTSLWLYNDMTANPDKYARMSDNQFYALRRELNESDFKHFSNERAKRIGAVPGSNGPGDLNSGAIKQALDERLRMLQIDPTPKDDGGAEAARIGGLRRFVDQYFMAAQREAGKKFDDAEVAQRLDALFAKNTTVRGWFSNSSGPLLGIKAGDIPATDKDGIKAAFKRQGIDNPTDAQLLNAYWNMKVARK
jgi:soluble lytic murein transglycosylase